MELDVLDRLELPDPTFSEWFAAWRRRWLLGERVRLLLANDETHVLVVADPSAAPPGRVPHGVVEEFQLLLELE